jgi:Tfp pilus assembly protein PilO
MPHIDKPIIIALTLFIILLLIFFLVFPEYQKFKELRLDLGIKKAEYNAEFDYYNSISKIYHELRARSEDIKKIDSALPSDPSLGKLVYYLQEQSSKNGLMLKSLFLSKATTATEKNYIKNISFTLNLLGNYSSLENFISSLEKSARIFEVANISFGSAQSLTSNNIFSFSMQINTHTY